MFWELLEKIEKIYIKFCQRWHDNKKKKAERFGRLAESIAVCLLRLKLYTILARRYRNGAGEIDIIATRHKTLAFIEVKARTGASSMEVLLPNQQQRIMNAAEMFISNKPSYQNHIMRFDLIMVGTTHLPIHIPDAWRR